MAAKGIEFEATEGQPIRVGDVMLILKYVGGGKITGQLKQTPARLAHKQARRKDQGRR